MKKISTLGLILFTTLTMYSQAPELMSYQAVVRDNVGDVIVSQNVSLRIEILQKYKFIVHKNIDD